ncbi:hypothetical protein N483_09620 [Pseudoalteromonas luteoviolacea NCIMB 1944]|nr:hypothetical protein N483_09620 [Pseudoalteromonas luteoviolacea NCIMB 1944]
MYTPSMTNMGRRNNLGRVKRIAIIAQNKAIKNKEACVSHINVYLCLFIWIDFLCDFDFEDV